MVAINIIAAGNRDTNILTHCQTVHTCLNTRHITRTPCAQGINKAAPPKPGCVSSGSAWSRCLADHCNEKILFLLTTGAEATVGNKYNYPTERRMPTAIRSTRVIPDSASIHRCRLIGCFSCSGFLIYILVRDSTALRYWL